MPRKKASRFAKYLQVSTPQEMHNGYSIAREYENLCVVGWPGQAIAEQRFNLLQSCGSTTFVPFNLPIHADGKMLLHHFCRKVLGQDTKNYPQQIGDCVSFGMKNACEYVLAVQKVLNLNRLLWRNVFPPYLYGTGRVFVGKQTDYSDGSVGSWQAEAVTKYGVLAADEPNVPAYSGQVAKKWGGGSGPPKEFVELAKIHLVKSAAMMKSWNDVVAAITNGYPCTVASNQGFKMEPDSDGFHKASGQWMHQMCIVGVDNKHSTPYALILNSWGDVHGHLKDFETQEDLPVGILRVRAETIERMVRQNDTFAVSQLGWFEEQKLPEDLFKLL